MKNKSFNFIKISIFTIIIVSLFILVPIFTNVISDKVSAANENKDRRIGCWWWHYDDGANVSKRTQYLNFLDEHGVTEIYYYAYTQLSSSSGRSEIHEFVQDANELNMRVSILYEYADGVMNGASNTLTNLKNNYESYKKSYPNDELYGFHFDIEPGLSEYIFNRYCNNFVKYLYILRDAGCEVEVDVGCGWGSYGENIELNGIKGLYNIIAANVDTMTLMSYRDTAKMIVGMGYDPMVACQTYGCACLFGVETDNANEGDQVDFSAESVEYLMEQVDKVFELLARKELTIEYGMAIHHARAFNNLRLYTPTTEAMKKTILYNKKDLTVHFSGSNSYVYTDPELVEAIHNDYQQYGAIDDTESYYKIVLSCQTGTTTYMYPCMYDATNDFDFWPAGLSDYPYGTTTTSSYFKNIGSFVRTIYYPKKQMMGEFTSEEDGIYIYIDDITSVDISAVTLEVYHPERLYPSDSEDSSVPEESSTVETSTTTSSNVESTSDMLGDANMDFSIDMKDVLIIRKYVAKMNVEINTDLADANMDSSVDLKDVLEIRRYIAHMPSILDFVYM